MLTAGIGTTTPVFVHVTNAGNILNTNMLMERA